MNNITKKNESPQSRKSLSDQLSEMKNSLHEQEQNILKKMTELGYKDVPLEEILTIEPDVDQDPNKAARILEVQENLQNLIKQKKYQDDIIGVEPAKLHEAVEAAEKLLARYPDYHFYQRGGALVRVIKSAGKSSQIIHGLQDSAIIADVDLSNLILALTELGHFMKHDGRANGPVPIDCPEKVARSLIKKQEWPHLPVLRGILHTPTLRIDGSILDTPGYDQQSGMLLITDDSFEKIPEQPTAQDVQQAKELLLGVLDEFPFENEASRSVVIAAILTTLTRNSYPSAPIFGFNASMMGSGKTLAADVVSYIATGSRNSVIAQAENEAEEKKRLFALLREGRPIVCFDNVTRPFGSPALSAIITEATYRDRILGTSETRVEPTNLTFLVTGNNLQWANDTSTRAIMCTLNPNVENPGSRRFKKDLHAYILAHRTKLVGAALTLLRAFYAAGKPSQHFTTPLRFKEWDDTVRAAIVWANMADPCGNNQEIEETDPMHILKGELFSAWYEVLGEKRITARELCNLEPNTEAHTTLIEIVKELVGHTTRGPVSAYALGSHLRSLKNSIVNGLKLQQVGGHQKTTLWQITKIEG